MVGYEIANNGTILLFNIITFDNLLARVLINYILYAILFYHNAIII